MLEPNEVVLTRFSSTSHVNLSELVYQFFWHNSSVLEVTYYAQNNASMMWKNLVPVLLFIVSSTILLMIA